MSSLLRDKQANQNLSCQKIIGIYCEAVNHFIETVAYLIAYKSQIKVLIIIPRKSNKSEHPWCLQRIKQYTFGDIELVYQDLQTQKLDYIYIEIADNQFIKNPFLKQWMRVAKEKGILTNSSYQHWKNIVKELVYSFPHYLSAKNIICQISSSRQIPYFFIKNKLFYSPSVHPQSIVKDDYRKLMFAPIQNIKRERNFKFSFMGNRNPPERIPILKQLKEKFTKVANIVNREQYLINKNISNNKINVLWIEYGDRDKVRGLSSPDYINALNQTDFCICPLGWGGNWTHRVIESLVRGAIPILEDAERYNIDLIDMQNCIVVKNKNWLEAIERAEQISSEELIRIQANVSQIREKYLLLEVSAKRLRKLMKLN